MKQRFSDTLKFQAMAVGLVLACFAIDVGAEKTTEMFIPIGQSPGLSGEYTYIGEIIAVNSRDGTVTVTDAAGTHIIKVTEHTKIWLDRSKLELSNRKGAFEDLQEGRLVEVKYESETRTDVAEWIKVQAD